MKKSSSHQVIKSSNWVFEICMMADKWERVML